MTTKKMPKNAKIFYCELCDFTCSKQSNYNKHISTAKHKNATVCNNYATEKCQKMPNQYTCDCGKLYKERTALWRHKQKCKMIEPDHEIIENIQDDNTNDNDTSSIKELFLTMMNENKELRNMLKLQQENHDKQMADIIPKIGNTNNSFNIQIFLNNECKNAVNINDFLESIQLQIQDLEKMKELGYVNGITRIFMNGLNKLDLTQRPLHCSDAKREVLYVKDHDGWEKDDKKEKLNKAISTVGRKTLQHFPEWMKHHPDCKSSNSLENNDYHSLVKNTMVQNTEDNKKKVAKNIIKEVVIDK